MLQSERMKYWWPVLISLALMISAAAVYRGTVQLDQVQTELLKIKKTNQELAKRNHALYLRVIRLKENAESVERAARRELGVIGRDEVVYQQGSVAAPIVKKD